LEHVNYYIDFRKEYCIFYWKWNSRTIWSHSSKIWYTSISI